MSRRHSSSRFPGLITCCQTGQRDYDWNQCYNMSSTPYSELDKCIMAVVQTLLILEHEKNKQNGPGLIEATGP